MKFSLFPCLRLVGKAREAAKAFGAFKDMRKLDMESIRKAVEG